MLILVPCVDCYWSVLSNLSRTQLSFQYQLLISSDLLRLEQSLMILRQEIQGLGTEFQEALQIEEIEMHQNSLQEYAHRLNQSQASLAKSQIVEMYIQLVISKLMTIAKKYKRKIVRYRSDKQKDKKYIKELEQKYKKALQTINEALQTIDEAIQTIDQAPQTINEAPQIIDGKENTIKQTMAQLDQFKRKLQLYQSLILSLQHHPFAQHLYQIERNLYQISVTSSLQNHPSAQYLYQPERNAFQICQASEVLQQSNQADADRPQSLGERSLIVSLIQGQWSQYGSTQEDNPLLNQSSVESQHRIRRDSTSSQSSLCQDVIAARDLWLK